MTDDPYLFILDVQNQVTQIREGQDEQIRVTAESAARIKILEENRAKDHSAIKDHNDRIIKIESKLGPVAAGLVMFCSAGMGMVASMIKDGWGGN